MLLIGELSEIASELPDIVDGIPGRFCRRSGGRAVLVVATLNMSSEVPGFDPRHLQTDFKLLGVSEC